MKFTPAGGTISVSVSREGEQARIEVRDSGIGIAQDACRTSSIPSIARIRRVPRPSGAGLGLSLVRWIVERHQGRIDVKSQPGQGSTFSVWLPIAAGSREP